MLEGMHSEIIHIVACVWNAGAEVIGGYISVNSGYVNALGKEIVIYLKRGNFLYFIHFVFPYFVAKCRFSKRIVYFF